MREKWLVVLKCIFQSKCLFKNFAQLQPMIKEKGGVIMSSGFKIYVYQNRSDLTLKLKGNFDKTLVNKLIHLMKKKRSSIPKVFIHDSCKKHIYPFEMEKI